MSASATARIAVAVATICAGAVRSAARARQSSRAARIRGQHRPDSPAQFGRMDIGREFAAHIPPFLLRGFTMPKPGHFRPELDFELSRDVEFAAAALQMTPVNFVRSAVSASVRELRDRIPELDRAMREREAYA